MVSPHTHDAYDRTDPYVRKQNAKLVQVIQNFFTKSVQIVLQARLLSESRYDKDDIGVKINKWFNLHMESNSDMVKDEIKLWKGFTDITQVPPMIIETYIDLRSINARETVLLKDENDHPWTVAKGGGKKHEVVLERWLIEFDRNDVSGSIIDELPLIYKQAIILFRSLYGFTRLMPAFKLKKLMNHSKAKKLPLGNKILDGKKPISSKGRIGLSKPIIPHQMLTTESHLTQRNFAPIQTTLGTLKVSVAYRNHYQFEVSDNEELLSNHFINMDSVQQETETEQEQHEDHVQVQEGQHHHPEQDQEQPPSHDQGTNSITGIDHSKFNEDMYHPDDDLEKSNTRSFNAISMSVSPFSSKHSTSPLGVSVTAPKKITAPHYSAQRPSIQPFKIGSISNSPPNITGSFGASSLERRISITSNKSASNASLAAMLRNPRSSTSSTTTSNIPIANSSSNTQYQSSFPRSVSSSHGQHDDNNPFSNPDTPRFSSSFGSRASRRYSNASMRHNSSVQDTIANRSSLGSLVGLTSSGIPLSGLYIDDDISDFVRMIDSKSDLRFSSYAHGSPNMGNSNANHSESKLLSNSSRQGSYSQLDVLNKFQLLKNQHQQLGDSVSASLILQHNNTSSGVNSRPSSRKSSHSNYSSPSLPPGSYDKHMPSINSRLKEATPGSESGSVVSSQNNLDVDTYSNKSTSSRQNSFHSNTLKTSNKKFATPVISTTTVHATQHNSSEPTDNSKKSNEESTGVTGLSTTPSTYLNKKHIYYENVFDDDDDDGEDYFLSHTNKNSSNSDSGKDAKEANRKKQASSSSRDIESGEDEDDDLLFTMSDMNLTKQ